MTTPLLVSRGLAQRDQVAAVIVRALEAESGVAELRQFIATLSVPPDEVDVIARRLQCGLEVAEAHQREVAPTATPLQRVLMQGALLFRAGLFFEVHEVLEAAWHRLGGAERTVVQGLIQVAVGMHHLAHGNPRGAASLFGSGRAKLAPYEPAFAGVDITALLGGLTAWEAAAAVGRWPTTLEPPPFVVQVSCVRARPPSS